MALIKPGVPEASPLFPLNGWEAERRWLAPDGTAAGAARPRTGVSEAGTSDRGPRYL